MAKKKQKPASPKVFFMVVLILLVGLVSFLLINSTSSNKISTNPNENPNNFAYGESNISTENGISKYTFNEFGHGYSFNYPADWQFQEDKAGSFDSSSMKKNSLKINDKAKISFGYFTNEDEFVINAPEISSQDLIIDKRPASLVISEGVVDLYTETYEYDNVLAVLNVNFSRRVTSKDIRKFEGKFIMKLETNERNKAKQAELNEEFKKVYETLKFSN